jgi:porphobilinogen synthase
MGQFISRSFTVNYTSRFIFFSEDDSSQQVIPSMPSVYRFGLKKLIDHLTPLVELGLKSILVFGVIDNLTKDETGTNADSKKNPVIKALPILRQKFPDLLIACDVCLCPYTSHGHCGIMEDGVINNERSIERIASIALEYARHGAQIVAPSDMMDNRILAIKTRLIENGMEKLCSVLSYSVKFASAFYGPFRDAAKSSPQSGDRKGNLQFKFFFIATCCSSFSEYFSF